MDATVPTDCYDAAPEFIDEDNRRFRQINPISKQQMVAKHSVLFPESLIRGKTILDLGCCLGATGQWCLSNGAAHYTGVEVQAGYADRARELLERYHPGKSTIHHAPIEKWLAEHPPTPTYDITCLLGVIYVFTDYFSILKSSAGITRETIAVDANHIGYPYTGLMAQFPDFCGVAFTNDQMINVAGEKASFIGRGTLFSPKGLEWLMLEFGFKSKEGILFPPPITDVMDIYNRPLAKLKEGIPVRYLMRFDRQEQPKKIRTLSEDLQTGEGYLKHW